MDRELRPLRSFVPFRTQFTDKRRTLLCLLVRKGAYRENDDYKANERNRDLSPATILLYNSAAAGHVELSARQLAAGEVGRPKRLTPGQ